MKKTINKKIFFQGLWALILGLGVGVFTLIGQKYLPGSLNSLANSGAIWLIPAFFMASIANDKFSAILLCIETLAVSVISYYLIESIVNNHSFDWIGYYFILWLVCALIAGVVFGLGAYFWKLKSKWYYCGASLLPAVFLSEGLIMLIYISEYMHMIPAVIGRIVLGLILYFFIYKSAFYRWKPILSFCLITILGVIGFLVLFQLT